MAFYLLSESEFTEFKNFQKKTKKNSENFKIL